MNTISIKTAALIGPALDWAAAKCEQLSPFSDGISWIVEVNGRYLQLPRYSTDWSQGGPIIEREGINTFKHNKLDDREPDKWCAHKVVPRPNMEGGFNMTAIAIDGPTPLIAAMRCYVASKLGNTVEIPKELMP